MTLPEESQPLFSSTTLRLFVDYLRGRNEILRLKASRVEAQDDQVVIGVLDIQIVDLDR